MRGVVGIFVSASRRPNLVDAPVNTRSANPAYDALNVFKCVGLSVHLRRQLDRERLGQFVRLAIADRYIQQMHAWS